MPTLYARTLKRAAQIIGAEQLALRLNVRPSHLALWMGGVETAPPDVFLKAVDLITEYEGPKNTPT